MELSSFEARRGGSGLSLTAGFKSRMLDDIRIHGK